MKSYTREEFVDYVKGLKFDELEDMALFVKEYHDYYYKIPVENKEERDNAWEKYIILLSKFGMPFIDFTLAVIDFRKKLNEELSKEDSLSRTLENGISEAEVLD